MSLCDGSDGSRLVVCIKCKNNDPAHARWVCVSRLMCQFKSCGF